MVNYNATGSSVSVYITFYANSTQLSKSTAGRSFTRFYNTSMLVTSSLATLVASSSMPVVTPVGKDGSDKEIAAQRAAHRRSTIAGSVVGSIAGLAFIVMAIIYMIQRYYRRQSHDRNLLSSNESERQCNNNDEEDSLGSVYYGTITGCESQVTSHTIPRPSRSGSRGSQSIPKNGPQMQSKSFFTETGSL